MNVFGKLVTGLALAGSLILTSSDAQAWTCTNWDAAKQTCISGATADLLPNASWCGAYPSPAPNEVLIYSVTSWNATTASSETNPLCQRVVVGLHNYFIDQLDTYGMGGIWGTHYIQSVWLGSNVQAVLYNIIKESGSQFSLNYGGFDADIMTDWEWMAKSLGFHRRP